MHMLVRHASRCVVLSLAVLLALAGPAGAKEFEEGEEVPEGEVIITGENPDEPVSSEEPGQPVADPDEDGVFEPAEPAPVLEEDGEMSILPAVKTPTVVAAPTGAATTLPRTGPSTGLVLLSLAGVAMVGGGWALVTTQRRGCAVTTRSG